MGSVRTPCHGTTSCHVSTWTGPRDNNVGALVGDEGKVWMMFVHDDVAVHLVHVAHGMEAVVI